MNVKNPYYPPPPPRENYFVIKNRLNIKVPIINQLQPVMYIHIYIFRIFGIKV
ncbi:hypothetical protein [Treponema pedis]|uniref:Uncharacterized protein n=1 Tax=Treponema pedis str. T A4 TaxID=1291379 RepID=S5ZMS8_9SPIR|nr:hypothetical protein [Treponema pedis]AGT43902.1 hypothetical protein TPE_1407 [Treponema pedis str. T A4]